MQLYLIALDIEQWRVVWRALDAGSELDELLRKTIKDAVEVNCLGQHIPLDAVKRLLEVTDGEINKVIRCQLAAGMFE